MKVVRNLLLLVFVVLIGYSVKILLETGTFRSIENYFDGSVVHTIQLPGAEDIAISYTDSFAIISSTNRGVYPPKDQEEGGLYFIDLKDNKFNPISLNDNIDFPFAPHGIDLLKLDSTYMIMAINHTISGHSIEVFHWINAELIHLKTIKDKALQSPNDIVIINENEFYFSNDHGYQKGIGKFLEEYGGLAASNVMYFDGNEFREVANKIAYSNGINYDSNKELLYVASPRNFLIKVYERNSNGSLNFIENIPCGTGVDNISIDTKGHLWSGGHPNLLRFASYAKGKKETAPSEIVQIIYRTKGNYDVNSIYLEDGSTMSGASSAIVFGDYIITGNVKDKKFLVLKRNK